MRKTQVKEHLNGERNSRERGNAPGCQDGHFRDGAQIPAEDAVNPPLFFLSSFDCFIVFLFLCSNVFPFLLTSEFLVLLFSLSG